MERHTKTLVLMLVIILTCILGIPYGIKVYKRHNAEVAKDEISSLKNSFDLKLVSAEKCIKERDQFFTGEERHELSLKLSNAQSEGNALFIALSITTRSFQDEKYDEAQTALESLRVRIASETQKIESLAAFCEQKLELRNKVLQSELYLKARLKKPYNFSDKESELPGDLAILPKDFLSYVPSATKELEERMRVLELGPEFNNSLGANLVKRKIVLDYITSHAKREPIKERARTLFRDAREKYSQVRSKNDEIPARYRPSHDGTYTTAMYADLDVKQQNIIALISAGDNALKQLDEYNSLLHTQECVYVWGHAYKEKEFSHTGVRPTTDSKGHLTVETYEYTTHGREFFCVMRKATQSGNIQYSERVGEIDDPVAMWSWSATEALGYVQKWKPLYDDQTYSGTMDSLKPAIEEEETHMANDPFEGKK